MRKQINRFLAIMLICTVVITLCSCAKKSETNVAVEQTEDGKEVWYLGGNNIFAGDVDVKSLFDSVAETVEPATIYSSVNYTESMLHGTYTLNNIEDDLSTVRETIPFADVDFKKGSESLSVLPIAVCFGVENICSSLTNYSYSEFMEVTDCEVAVLQFAMQEKKAQVICSYETSGDRIIFKQLEQTSDENAPFTYEYTGVEFTYNFAISGVYCTFSQGNNSLALKAYAFTENTDSELSLNGYSLPDSPLIDDLDYFASSTAWNYAVKRDGSYYDLSAYKISEDGKFTIYLSEKDFNGESKTFAQQYACIIQSSSDNFLTNFSVILLDGSTEYYYVDDITDREARILKEQDTDVGSLSKDKIKEIAEKKEDLYKELHDEFKSKGIDVTVNRSSGEIAMDASVLFGGDSAVITSKGKTLLNKFLDVYTSIIFSEKYKDFISKTIVEGHTAPAPGITYKSGLALSKNRAKNVQKYCLSSKTGVDTSKLKSKLETVGLSIKKPVYNSKGEVDLAASRRVSFRFVVNVK